MATSPAAAPPPVRVRLVFDSSRLLRRPQRDEGLRCCWLLLRPELATVADLAAYVADRFRLGRSCSRGVILSMDKFTLPPFESTSIFRDKDIVRVKQKSCKNMIQHDDMDCVQDPKIVEKQPLPTDDKILAIEYKKLDNKHQGEEQGGHQHHKNAISSHNIESIDTSSKRKCQDGDAGIPGSSRKKKVKVMNPEKAVCVSKKDTVYQYEDKSGSKNLMSSSIDIVTRKASTQDEITSVLEAKKKMERNHQPELNCGTKVECDAQSEKKLESRSARRKKLKRRLRQEAKAHLEKIIQEESQTTADCPSSINLDGFSCPPDNHNGFSCPPSNQHKSQVPVSDHRTDEEESDSSEDIVPVVVRPGHIRFERAGAEQEKLPANGTQGTFQWSATMSKKKGQKWGMNDSKRKKADINYDARIIGSSNEVSHHVVEGKITENGSCGVDNQKVGESSINNSSCVNTAVGEEKSSGGPLDFNSLYPLTRLPKVGESSINNSTCANTSVDEEKSSGGPLDFKSLYPLMRLPKEGDLIAYRLVELSSSWCPELSSYRVGKVMIYDPISLRIILIPVPDYPIISEERKSEDESDMPLDMSPYKEDGSLEIEYSSLLDVRLLKGYESAPVPVSTPFTETGNRDVKLAGKPNTLDKSNGNIDSEKAILVQNNTRTSEAKPEKTQKTVWEETDEVANYKSDVQENGWGSWTPNASTSAWSLRALRSSAIGPTVAILRGNNNQRGKPSNRKYGK